jgi:serine/threonine-protein kinase HipA
MSTCWFCYKDADGADYHPNCAKKFFGHPIVPELILDDRLIQQLAEKTVNRRIAVTGVQPKLSVTLEKAKGEINKLTIVGLWGEYILKPQQKKWPFMPETEDLTMHLASLFKIDTCDHTLMRASDGNLVYLAKRFDRERGRKIHMEDLCQLSEFMTENKYKGSYEKAGKLVNKYCVTNGFDILSYFEVVLFSYLSGNNDMHLKNFSLLHTPQGVALSPAYDLLNASLINPVDNEEMALTLNGRKKKIRKTDFIALGQSLNIPAKAIENSFSKFAGKNSAVNDLIDRSFLDEEKKAGYKEIWRNRQKLLAE